MNETLQTIANRASCRAFNGVLPEKTKLEAIALAAVQSPSAVNSQPWEIVVITDKVFIEEMENAGMQVLEAAEDKSFYERIMSRGGKLLYNTPCMFMILKKAGSEMDCGIVAENIALASTSLGLGNVIAALPGLAFKGPKGPELMEKIGFPEGYEFGITVLIGEAAELGTQHAVDMSKVRFM